MLLDRLPERAALSALLEEARAGRSGVLVVRGEPGVGKTALLDWAVESAAGLRVVRVAGVESEMELAFAAVQQLCAPMLDQLAGLPDPQRAARELLASVVGGPLDERVRDRILAETRGNPLALLELPRGGPGVPGARGSSARIEESFRGRVEVLPAATRRLMLVAAAEPAGDPGLVWRAAQRLGIGAEAAWPAADAGLLTIGERVLFRHPLVRSAVYRAAGPADRRAAHRALAGATDPQADPDRRAWHRAQATPGPDEDVAAELERSAGRAQARGGLAAAAAFLERAAALTLDPA